MFKRVKTLFISNTLASLGVACILNSGLGCFSITAANMAVSGWLNMPLSMAAILIETVMIIYATIKGEGLGLTALVNATYGSIMIDVFHRILICHPLLVIGGLIIPVAWAYMGKVGFGDTGSNILMTALSKTTGKSLRFIRTLEEGFFFTLGLLGASQYVSLFTLFLTFILGPILQVVYNFVDYDPLTIEHKYIIKGR